MKLKGNKTYIIGGALILYAIAGLVAGKLEFNQAFEQLMIGAGLMGLRNALENTVTS